MSPRPGAFLDRDGAIIEDTGFVRDPQTVRLVRGAGEAIRRLNDAGWPVVVVTNQSGIARGRLTEGDYIAVARRIEELLAAEGAWIDATYMCPHWPELSGPCDCRKPGLRHYRTAIAAHEIDPARSIFVGDKLTDLEPARALGGRGVLVLTGEGTKWATAAAEQGFDVAADLLEAVTTLTIDN
jgi:histidinol-phosphate phosphatase family protein